MLMRFYLASVRASGSFSQQAIAIKIHYLVLSVFFWNAVMAWDLYQTFGKQSIISRFAEILSTSFLMARLAPFPSLNFIDGERLCHPKSLTSEWALEKRLTVHCIPPDRPFWSETLAILKLQAI